MKIPGGNDFNQWSDDHIANKLLICFFMYKKVFCLKREQESVKLDRWMQFVNYTTVYAYAQVIQALSLCSGDSWDMSVRGEQTIADKRFVCYRIVQCCGICHPLYGRSRLFFLSCKKIKSTKIKNFCIRTTDILLLRGLNTVVKKNSQVLMSMFFAKGKRKQIPQ